MNLTEFLNQTIWGGLKWQLALEKRLEDPKYLESYGYKVYSQNDEDGIIHEIFERIGVTNKTFIEFGVDKGIECNCHSLLLQGWKGLWIEGRAQAYDQILRRFAPAIRQKKLDVINKYVTVDNINEILRDYGEEEPDILSIDVDGNDWHIWNAINGINPRLVIIEYQGKFPPEIDWKMAYNKDHIWDRSDRSGASLKAMEKLGTQKGYQLVGTNITGANAFFVRSDLTKDLFSLPATAENLYNPTRLNVGIHRNGHLALNYVGQDIEGMVGVFEYYPDWNCLSSFGFWKVEVLDGFRRNIIRELEAKLFIRFMPSAANYIQVHYNVNVPLAMLEGPLTIKFDVGGLVESNFTITEQKGLLTIPIGGVRFEEEIIPVLIRTNKLWVPDLMIHNHDARLQGIAIDKIEYIEDGKEV
ncbi:MAG: hypothetical protein J1E98_05145 [Lachnospiraceae bacterium]|nr:hypothetical protein [Lachnospiraceae bacterium]